MLTGERAFHGASPADTMSAVLRAPPDRVGGRSGLSPALARIVRRCLEKNPHDRFQSARDLTFALESISDAAPAAAAVTRADDKSVAVLPFANMSADAENQYFSDGLAEELINALTRLPGLHVGSRTSAFRFRGREADIRQIGAISRSPRCSKEVCGARAAACASPHSSPTLQTGITCGRSDTTARWPMSSRFRTRSSNRL